jgi:hypothetical protein
MLAAVDTCGIPKLSTAVCAAVASATRTSSSCDARSHNPELHKAEPDFVVSVAAVHATKTVVAVRTAPRQCEILCAAATSCNLQTHTYKHVRID